MAFLDVSDISVQYGLTVISNNEGLNIIPAQQLVRHEKYAPSNQYKNDIGLVKLKYPLNITLKGYRVKLPVLGAHFETGTPVEMSGWGTNSVSFQKCFQVPLNVLFAISKLFADKWAGFHGDATESRSSSVFGE